MRLLSLDLSTRVGWSLWLGPADRAPTFGTKRLAKSLDADDIASRTLALRLWLREMIEAKGPDVLAFEAPWIPMTPGDTTQHTLRLQVSLASEVDTTARECGVARVLEVASSTAKKALTGTGRILSRDKPLIMVRAARARGWDVLDDHQADAAAVALVAYAHLGLTHPACALAEGPGVVPA